VADVLLEEIGHSVDSRLNITDSPGDEGAIFATVVQGKVLSEGELQGLRGEDDHGTFIFNGQAISIEKAFDWGNNWGVQAWNRNINSKSWEPLWNGKAKDFGSATRSDGKKGFAKDWGDGSPGDGVNNDFFLLGFWTQADFQKDQSYKFQVRADDRYYIAAYPVNGNKWELINWEGKEDAYGGKEIQWKPENDGKYWLFSYYMERDGNAYFDISWDKISNSSPVESNNNSQVYTAQAFVNSWQNLPEYTNRNPFPDKGQNCTWYAHGRMLQLGYSKAALDTMWGNAGTWDNTAKNGATVSNTPQAPSIAVWEPGVGGAGGVGHVAVVERVNSDGSILISESNWDKTQYNTRTISRNSRYWPSEFITVPKA
jgi:surface antigen